MPASGSARGEGLRIVVTGRDGQLARSLAERARGREGFELVFAGRPEFDLLDHESIARAAAAAAPDVVINAAAMTAVDAAEGDPAAAEALNAVAPGAVARAAREAGAAMVQLSTDYVFDGEAGRPYVEDDAPSPINVYGRTKLAGEEAVRAATPDHLIVRTSWVYSPFGANFVTTMLKLAREHATLKVVEDQIGCPTSALDLADGLLAAIAAGIPSGGATYHLAAAGEASWADLARRILEESAARGGPRAEVIGISAAEWRAAAARPRDSRLDSGRFARDFHYRAPAWIESLGPVVERLLA